MLKKYLGIIFLWTISTILQAQQNSQSPPLVTGSVCFVSDYRYRGLSQTMRRPAVQGILDYTHQSGVYLGTFGSNVDGTTHYYNNTSLEWDFYGGYKKTSFFKRFPDLAYNAGLIYYYYPGGQTHKPHSVHYNTAEFYVELSYKWLSVRYWQTLTNYFGFNSDNPPFNWQKNQISHANGSSRGSRYIDVNLTFELYEKLNLFSGHLKGGKLNLLLHVGHQTLRHYTRLSYTEWKAALMQTFDWFNVFASYVGTDGNRDYYGIRDHSYHSRKRQIAGRELILGVIRTF
jgi:Bacterial protein of unknown function (Gcw_chp)